MKLSKLYSNDPRFKKVVFGDKFNIVLGEITDSNNLTNDSHNIGKSTMITLINFMLIKELNKRSFLKNDSFKNHVFYLEIILNSGEYVTIKRAVNNNTKISLAKYSDLLDESSIRWDYEDLSLNSKDDDKNPKRILNKWLAFDVLKGEEYRRTSGYFLRTQDDYRDVFKLEKYKGADANWKPILFELLGFNGEHMLNKYIIETEIANKEKLIENIKDECQIDTGKLDKLKGLIEIAEEKRDEILIWLDGFDFYKKESSLNKEVIEEVENNISKLNTIRYNLEFELQQIEESLKVDVEFNVEDTVEIYKEVGIYFPEQLVKEYEELLEFNRKLSVERKKYLRDAKKEKIDRLELVEKELMENNERRKQLLKGLKQTDTFDKYNSYRDDLIVVEREIERYKTEINSIDNVKNIQDEIRKLKNKLNMESEKLSVQIAESTEIYKSIRKDFHDYVQEILGHEAIMSLDINSNGNIDFKVSFINMENEETAQANGHTYKKILCACFDLAVVKNYMSKSFYRFIYHDGCLESLDPRKQIKYLSLVRRISRQYNVQYILTCLSSELPQAEEYQVKDQEIAVKLSDDIDDTGRLFGFEF